jgi:AraC-like DNA-binding protein
MNLFFDQRMSDSPFVESVWHTQSENAGSFISSAVSHWEMVLMRYKGKATFTVRGPETKATPADFPADAEWLGITFRLGAFMPDLLPGSLLDRRDMNLPEATAKSFWLYGSTWEFPTYENADTFVKRLVCSGLLVQDPLVNDVIQDHPLALSPRALQYRFKRATGLTHKTVRQIQRTRQAVALLEQGRPILDTAYQLGYFDQSHLTNSLRRYMGQTPTQISHAHQPE